MISNVGGAISNVKVRFRMLKREFECWGCDYYRRKRLRRTVSRQSRPQKLASDFAHFWRVPRLTRFFRSVTNLRLSELSCEVHKVRPGRVFLSWGAERQGKGMRRSAKSVDVSYAISNVVFDNAHDSESSTAGEKTTSHY